jgi:NAD(P)-dependent dehydrogenase (short-subunit alcohol dehydrogenase family)
MGRLAGKVAVITGGASGMGKCMVELFAAEGAKVVVADRSGKQDEVAAKLGDSGLGVQVDVSVSADIQAMIKAAEDKFGKIDILVNNAGFGGGLMPLAEFPDEHFDKVVDTNLRGVFLGMKYGIQSMLRSGGGSIVNTASISAMGGWAGHGIYGSAKAGVIQMTRTAALDYAAQNIRCNSISPGVVWTGLAGPRYQQFPEAPDDVKPPYDIPIYRFGKGIELAYAALFFASDESSFVTGVNMPVDGGYIAGPAKKMPTTRPSSV